MSLYNDITILIVTYKSEHIIKKTIGNLNSNFNIIVCENSSNIIFKELIESIFDIFIEIFITFEIFRFYYVTVSYKNLFFLRFFKV